MNADPSQVGVSLSDLLSPRRFYKTHDIRVSSCCTNPELCREGDLYVATINADRDGHDGAATATNRGVVGILCERLLPIDVPQCIVPNAKVALAALCQRLAGNPANQLPVIGVAGLHGLTTCGLLLERLLEKAGYRPAGFNSLSYHDGFESIPRVSQSTSAAQHAQWLANVLANGCSHAIVELPRNEVAHRTYDATPLNSLILTEFAAASHRRTPSPKTHFYFERIMKGLDEDGLLVANVDCPVVRNLLTNLDRPVLTVSCNGVGADLRATTIEQIASEQTFMLCAGYDTAVVRTKVIGASHIQACLLAAATGLGMGIDLPTIVSGIESLERVPGHLERIECGQPFSVFSDGAPTCNDLNHALRTLREVTRGRLICVFGQSNSSQVGVRYLRGRVVEKLADLCVVTSDDPYDTHPLRATHDVLDGIQEPSKVHVMPNRIRAIEWALAESKPGDTLLLAGPHNRHLVRSEDDFLSDSDVARYWLYQTAQKSETHWMLARR